MSIWSIDNCAMVDIGSMTTFSGLITFVATLTAGGTKS